MQSICQFECADCNVGMYRFVSSSVPTVTLGSINPCVTSTVERSLIVSYPERCHAAPETCHAELVSASSPASSCGDPETSSG